MRCWFLAALFLMVLPRMNAESKFDFATTPGKLPKDVVPVAYAIRIAPDLEKLTFAGSETVQLTVQEPVTKIVLNALEIEIAVASKRRRDAGELRKKEPAALGCPGGREDD